MDIATVIMAAVMAAITATAITAGIATVIMATAIGIATAMEITTAIITASMRFAFDDVVRRYPVLRPKLLAGPPLCAGRGAPLPADGVGLPAAASSAALRAM